VLWQPPEDEAGSAVDVDPMLTRWLRPHQREGTQFMFDCVCGLRSSVGQGASSCYIPYDFQSSPLLFACTDFLVASASAQYEGRSNEAHEWHQTFCLACLTGCILADDMGLGKTLQGIALLWTLLTAGHPLLGGNPIAKRIIIVCPTSLVGNWDSECQKWLKVDLLTCCRPYHMLLHGRPSHVSLEVRFNVFSVLTTRGGHSGRWRCVRRPARMSWTASSSSAARGTTTRQASLASLETGCGPRPRVASDKFWCAAAHRCLVSAGPHPVIRDVPHPCGPHARRQRLVRSNQEQEPATTAQELCSTIYHLESCVRMLSDRFCGTCSDLLICDEAHRLKNDATQTNRALDSLACKRRVLLSGTPMQNHLDEV
jgi:SNF2-related domain